MRERDLYFDFAEFVPGEIVEDLQTLISRMKEVLISPAKTSVDDSFRQFFLGLLDGSSTRRTTDLIYDMLDGTDQPTYINSVSYTHLKYCGTDLTGGRHSVVGY